MKNLETLSLRNDNLHSTEHFICQGQPRLHWQSLLTCQLILWRMELGGFTVISLLSTNPFYIHYKGLVLL